MDILTITDIILSTKIGIYDWEQQIAQNLHLDLSIGTDAAQAAAADDIHQAVNYESVVDFVCKFAGEHHFQLLETFGDKLANALLAEFKMPFVQVTLKKPGALLKTGQVGIIIARAQAPQ